jgi:hypothetical protein
MGIVLSPLQAQTDSLETADTLMFRGQLIGWSNVNPGDGLGVQVGLRYLPQLNLQQGFTRGRLLDAEVSANILGTAQVFPAASANARGRLKPYRLWGRYSGKQWELRAGLQKISFGSASLLRPLMWFDQIDPRDPVQFTDGVWGVLGRYYWLNNANVWAWGLYGNARTKGWELSPTVRRQPEYGGRLQLPVPRGELAFSWHQRQAQTTLLHPDISLSAERRLGLDVRLDLAVGCWFEASWTRLREPVGAFRNQLLMNAGLDYTIGVGNGLYLIYEQLLTGNGAGEGASLSLLSAAYPMGLSDHFGALVYYDWARGQTYRFINWRRQFDRSSLLMMAYWNPADATLPTQSATQNPYAGYGLQVIYIYNH